MATQGSVRARLAICPGKLAAIVQVLVFQNFTPPRLPAVINKAPSGEKPVDHTAPAVAASVVIRTCRAGSQILAVPSWLPEASSRLSGEKARQVTIQLWPVRVANWSPLHFAQR